MLLKLTIIGGHIESHRTFRRLLIDIANWIGIFVCRTN